MSPAGRVARFTHSTDGALERWLAVLEAGPVRDALLDLLLGSTCAVCARPGRALCTACRTDLPTTPLPATPSPCPPGLAPTVVMGEYGGPLKLLVNAHKEQGRFALAEPLGHLLALSALAVAASTRVRAQAVGAATRVPGGPSTGSRRLLLVPVPSRAAVVRRRGHDPLLRVAQRAAAGMRRVGVAAAVARLLRSSRTVRDQAGLGAAERARNVADSMACSPSLSSPHAVHGATLVVVVDDVVTTGATVREAQRALEDAGVAVCGIAAVAATRRTGAGGLSRSS